LAPGHTGCQSNKAFLSLQRQETISTEGKKRFRQKKKKLPSKRDPVQLENIILFFFPEFFLMCANSGNSPLPGRIAARVTRCVP
jgi:hypothetical protein